MVLLEHKTGILKGNDDEAIGSFLYTVDAYQPRAVGGVPATRLKFP